MEKDKIEVTLKGFKNEDLETPVLVHTDLTIVNQKLEITSPSMIKSQHIDVRKNKPNDMLVQNIVTGCTMAMNRALVNVLREPKKCRFTIGGLLLLHLLWGKLNL